MYMLVHIFFILQQLSIKDTGKAVAANAMKRFLRKMISIPSKTSRATMMGVPTRTPICTARNDVYRMLLWNRDHG